MSSASLTASADSVATLQFSFSSSAATDRGVLLALYMAEQPVQTSCII